MKRTLKLVCLLATAILMLSLAAAALAEGEEPGDTPEISQTPALEVQPTGNDIPLGEVYEQIPVGIPYTGGTGVFVIALAVLGAAVALAVVAGRRSRGK